MTIDKDESAVARRRRIMLACAALMLFGALIYYAGLRVNPPGFFVDESSIAFNAFTITEMHQDEHGESWPLFFRAFGEYKNPVYIYLLAAVFRFTGPGILVARSLSATIGLATVVLIGLLAFRLSNRLMVGVMVAVTALLTPWLFELSRLVMEVALYPFAVALYLVLIRRVAGKPRWTWFDISSLAASLALLTYSYSIGRLLAPLLALGLIILYTRDRIKSIALTWLAFGITLLPLWVFQRRHPGALSLRFRVITYIVPQSTTFQIIKTFIKHYFHNLSPWRLFVQDSSKVSEIVHLPGAPTMLSVTAILVLASIIILYVERRFDAWWRFVIFGLIVSVVPASLTNDYFHMLRLAPMPVFLIVLTIPAIQWLAMRPSRLKRAGILTVMILIAAQAVIFQWQYHASAVSPERLHTFDADYPRVILPAGMFEAEHQTIYLADNIARPGYIQAFWYAVINGVPLKTFVYLLRDTPFPENSVVITTEEILPRCRVLAKSEPYTTCVAEGPPRVPQRLPDDGFAAEISVADPPVQISAGEQIKINVRVKNASNAKWEARERSGSALQLYAANHWLDSRGEPIIKDDGRGALPQDLSPEEETTIPLIINAPHQPGEYLLEIDMLQEGVSWFGQKGSRTWRGRVMVAN